MTFCDISILGMDGVALLASHWNTPVFGWVSQDLAFQDKTMYSTLVRFLGPLNRFRECYASIILINTFTVNVSWAEVLGF